MSVTGEDVVRIENGTTALENSMAVSYNVKCVPRNSMSQKFYSCVECEREHLYTKRPVKEYSWQLHS